MVNQSGEFVRDLGCEEVVSGPDRGNLWTCAACGKSAVFEEDGVAG